MVYAYHEMATRGTTSLPALAGANILKARLTKGMTQHEVATELGTSVSRVSGWENAKHLPQRKVRQPLADLLFEGDVSEMFRVDKEPVT